MKRNVAESNFRTTGFDQNPWCFAMFLQPQTKDLVTDGCPETVVEFPGKVGDVIVTIAQNPLYLFLSNPRYIYIYIYI